jgi:alpha-1,6-mannosyltransferase
VVSALSALPDIVGPAGPAADDDGAAFAEAVQYLLARPEQIRRSVARGQAERYGWPAAVEAFLIAHDAAPHAADHAAHRLTASRGPR